SCIRNQNHGLPSPVPTGKSFVLVVDGSWTGANNDLLNNLQSILTTIIQDTTQVATGWFNYYVAYIAYDKAHVARDEGPIKDTDSASFITKVVNAVNNNKYQSAGQSRAYMQALTNALSDPGITYGSYAYVLGASNVEDVQNVPLVLDAAAPTGTT
ncbi:C-type lectin, partial [Aphelenchoides avenae]